MELTLDDMLKEPIVRLVMRRDGVTDSDLRALMARVARAVAASRRRRNGAGGEGA